MIESTGCLRFFEWDRSETIFGNFSENVVQVFMHYISKSPFFIQYFCAPLSPRSFGPSGAPPPTLSGPEPL